MGNQALNQSKTAYNQYFTFYNESLSFISIFK